MKKVFIAVGVAFVCVLAFADYAHEEQTFKEHMREKIAQMD